MAAHESGRMRNEVNPNGARIRKPDVKARHAARVRHIARVRHARKTGKARHMRHVRSKARCTARAKDPTRVMTRPGPGISRALARQLHAPKRSQTMRS